MNRSAPSNRTLIDQLKKEGKPLISEIEDALIFKNSNPNVFGQRNINKSNLNLMDKQNRINYTEAMKFINKFNKNMTNSIDSYILKSQENNVFKKSFNRIKKLQQKFPSNETEKINYIFGNLIKKYSQRGLKITKQFFDKDIYKECGLLLMNNDLNKFYKYESALNRDKPSKKAEKNINFLRKIEKQAQKLYNKKLLERKNLEDEKENIIYFNGGDPNNLNNNEQNNNNMPSQPQEKKLEIKNKRQNLNFFLNRINIIIREIKEEKDEIKKLKKLIIEEEKMISLQKKKFNEENNINLENSEFSNKRRDKKTKTINPIMALHFGQKNKNDKKKLVSEESKVFSSTDNVNKENTSQSNIINNQNNNIQSESTNITNNNIKENSNINYLNKIYNHLTLAKIMRKRLSSITLFNRNKNFHKSNSLINLKKKRIRRVSLEVPKNLKKSLTVSDTYEKISNLDFISYKEDTTKKREKVSKLLKKYYGRRYPEFNMKNNHIKILNNFVKLREEIIKSEKNNDFYIYNNDLPQLMKKNIEINLEQNEKLKNYGSTFIQSFYDKKLKDD